MSKVTTHSATRKRVARPRKGASAARLALVASASVVALGVTAGSASAHYLHLGDAAVASDSPVFRLNPYTLEPGCFLPGMGRSTTASTSTPTSTSREAGQAGARPVRSGANFSVDQVLVPGALRATRSTTASTPGRTRRRGRRPGLRPRPTCAPRTVTTSTRAASSCASAITRTASRTSRTSRTACRARWPRSTGRSSSRPSSALGVSAAHAAEHLQGGLRLRRPAGLRLVLAPGVPDRRRQARHVVRRPAGLGRQP